MSDLSARALFLLAHLFSWLIFWVPRYVPLPLFCSLTYPSFALETRSLWLSGVALLLAACETAKASAALAEIVLLLAHRYKLQWIACSIIIFSNIVQFLRINFPKTFSWHYIKIYLSSLTTPSQPSPAFAHYLTFYFLNVLCRGECEVWWN
jgi:hypothetical protein